MKSILVLLSLVVSLGAFAHQDVVSVQATKDAILDITNTDKTIPSSDPCYAGESIPQNRFAISKLTTMWKGEGNFRPTLILVKVPATQHSGAFQCSFSSKSGNDSIALALGFPSNEVNKGSQDSVTAESICSIHCGAFPIADKEHAFDAPGKVILYGIQTKVIDGRVEDLQVKTEDNFTVHFLN